MKLNKATRYGFSEFQLSRRRQMTEVTKGKRQTLSLHLLLSWNFVRSGDL